MKIIDYLFSISLFIVALIASYIVTEKKSINFNAYNNSSVEIPFFDKKEFVTFQRVAHSPSITKLNNSQYLVAYFAGSVEGAKDIAIYGNIFSPSEYSSANLTKEVNFNNLAFSKQKKLISRNSLRIKSKQYIKRIGNPVLFQRDGNIYLFVVATNIGGWATSKIYVLKASVEMVEKHFNDESSDISNIFTLQGHYLLSPILNMSNLVRANILNATKPMLPLYFEMSKKFPLIAILDSNMHINEIIKPNLSQNLLQPSITYVPDKSKNESKKEGDHIYSSKDCLVVYRNSLKSDGGQYMQHCSIQNSSLNFSKLKLTNLRNIDSSVAISTLGNKIIIVYNEKLNYQERGRLSLGIWDGKDFVKVMELDRNTKYGVSYPNIAVFGEYAYIAYDSGNVIKIISLNEAYLDYLQSEDR